MNFVRTEHNIIGDQTFTEDGILIHTIRGHCRSEVYKHLTLKELKAYFANFGEILNADLQGESDRKYCVIQFTSPQSATKALQNKIHYIGDLKFVIHACCSLEQIDNKKILKQLNATLKQNSIFNNDSFWNSSFSRSPESPILALNEYCLEVIFRFLPLPDQIYFAATCKRFCAVFAWISTARYQTLHTDNIRKLTPLRIGIFLQIVGPLIKALKLNALSFVYESDHYLKFAGLYCTNVVNLTLMKCFKAGGFCIGRFLKRMTSLEELTLHLTDTEHLSRHLREFKNFKSLKIFMSRINESEMHTLTGLQNLVLLNSERREPDLRVLFRSLTNLCHLDIRTKFLERGAFNLIAKHLLQLQTLRITYSKGNFIALAKLPKLKKLDLELEANLDRTTKKCAKDLHLAASMAQHLEDFRIATKSEFIRSTEIASCLTKMENLKVLHWEMKVSDEILSIFSQLTKLEEIVLGNCVEITDEGVLSLLKNCSKLKKIAFSNLNVKEIDRILLSSAKLLKEQRTVGLRDGRVSFLFEQEFFFQHFSKLALERELVDVLATFPNSFISEEIYLFLLSMTGEAL